MDIIPQDDQPCKQCFKCKEWFPATRSYFYKDSQKSDGFRPVCKKCKGSKNFGKEIREGERQCTKCLIFFPITNEYFYENSRSHVCKKCTNEVQRRYHRENREKELARSRRYRTIDREVVNARRRASYLVQREKRLACHRRSYQTYKEKIGIRHRLYRENNRHIFRAIYAKRRASKVNAPGFHTSQDIQEQYKRQKGKCYYCHNYVKWGEQHMDHIIPLSRGGSNDISNLVMSCPTCNMKKGAKFPHEWPEGGRLL